MHRFRARGRARWVFDFIVFGSLAVVAFGGLVMLLWNALLPQLFHLPLITFWQALGVLILSKLLFGGFRGGPGRRWKRRMDGDWASMTPEEREKIRQEWGKRCGRRFDMNDYGRDRAQTSTTPGAEKQAS